MTLPVYRRFGALKQIGSAVISFNCLLFICTFFVTCCSPIVTIQYVLTRVGTLFTLPFIFNLIYGIRNQFDSNMVILKEYDFSYINNCSDNYSKIDKDKVEAELTEERDSTNVLFAVMWVSLVQVLLELLGLIVRFISSKLQKQKED